MQGKVDPRATRNRETLSMRSVLVRTLAGLVLVVAAIVLTCGNVVLNRYVKGNAERAFDQAHAGFALKLGELDYTLRANRLAAQSVTLSSTGTIFRSGRISLTGVRWTRLFRGRVALAELLSTASLEATNLNLDFSETHYGIRCAGLQASVPGSELIAVGCELRPLLEDEAFFAADGYRAPRFHAVVPECRVSGLEYGEALEGKAYRARLVHFSSPFFETLVNRDKLPKPFVKSPAMVHEAMAAIRPPVQIGTLTATNGLVKYCERLAVGTQPAVLTIGAVSLSAEGVANRGEAGAAIQVHGMGDLMNAGTIRVAMSIPINPPDFSLHYSGSITAMDLPCLDAFLDIAEHTRIKSGTAQEAAFEIDVAAGHARGQVRGIYKNLEIALLDKQTGDDKGLNSRVASFFANVVKIRNANTPDMLTGMKEGQVNYTRKPDDQFMQFVWFALRTGVLDIISH